MKNIVAEQIIRKSDRVRDITEKEIYRRRDYINIAIEYIKKVSIENPKLSFEEIKYKVLSDINAENEKYCSTANVRGRFLELEALWSIEKDPNILSKYYSIIKDEEKYNKEQNFKIENIVYNFSFSKSCKTVVKTAYQSVKDIKENISEDWRKIAKKYYDSDEKEKEKIKKLLNKEQLKDLEIITAALYISEERAIYEILKRSIKTAEEELKEKLIEGMEFVGEKFKKHNLLEKYKKSNDKNMSKYGLEEYTYPISGNDKEQGIEDIFSSKFLQTLELEDIIMLNTFWQNRYSKECQQIGEAIFAIDTLNLWDKILQGKDININDKEIKGVSNKIKCVSQIAASIIKYVLGKNKEVSEEEIELGYKTVFSEGEIEKIVQQEQENYRKIFKKQIPSSKNNLGDDILTYKVVLNLVENIYIIRNSIFICRIRGLLNSKKCKNWGIILDEFDKNIENEYVLIGIDQEGLNMPIRLHIKKEQLSEALRLYNKETKVPIYEGDKDFVIGNELIPTNILMPVQKKQRKALLERCKNIEDDEEEVVSLLEHLRFLRDQSKYPEHLKEKVNTRKGIIRKRPERKYYDLETGKIYYRGNDGKYVLFEDEGGKGSDGR